MISSKQIIIGILIVVATAVVAAATYVGAVPIGAAAFSAPSCVEANGRRAYDMRDYCDDHPCRKCVDDCDSTTEIILCCDYESGACSVVEYVSSCHPEMGYTAICEHGYTLASGGIECFD